MDYFFNFLKVILLLIIGFLSIKYRKQISDYIYNNSIFPPPKFKILDKIILFPGLLLIIASIMGLIELVGKLLK